MLNLALVKTIEVDTIVIPILYLRKIRLRKLDTMFTIIQLVNNGAKAQRLV